MAVGAGWRQEYRAILCCPISASDDIMEDPVRVDCPSGHTFEREEIQGWVEKHNDCPLCRIDLRSKELFPNIHVRSMIEFWKKMDEGQASLVGRVQPPSEAQLEQIVRAVVSLTKKKEDEEQILKLIAEIDDLPKVMNISSIQNLASVFVRKGVSTELFTAGMSQLRERISPQSYEIFKTALVFAKARQEMDQEKIPRAVRLPTPNAPSAPPRIEEEEPLINNLSLHDAVFRGDLRAAQELIHQGAEVNERDKTGNTPMVYAKTAPLIQLLLWNGARIQQTGLNVFLGDNKPFLKAIEQQDVVTVKDLLQRGMADVNAKLDHDQTPLHKAAIVGNPTIALLLIRGGSSLEAKDDEGYTSLHSAAEHGSERVVVVLLQEGADANAKAAEGNTPLILAAFDGHEGAVSRLLAGRARVDDTGYYGKTAFIMAIKFSRVMEILRMANANIRATDNSGATAFHYAAWNGLIDWINFFLKEGFAVDLEDHLKRTPLMFAAQKDNVPTMQLLLARKANLYARSSSNRTVLHWAAMTGAVANISYLLGLEFDIEVVDNDGWTPLYLAASKGKAEAVRVLGQRGANCNATDLKYGRTALFKAVEEDHNGVVQVLLELHANPNIRREGSWTPLHKAALKGNYLGTQLLVKAKADLRARASINLTGYGSVDGQQLVSGVSSLHIAAKGSDRANNRAIVRLLLDAGADPTAKDSKGRAPYLYASNSWKELYDAQKSKSCCCFV